MLRADEHGDRLCVSNGFVEEKQPAPSIIKIALLGGSLIPDEMRQLFQNDSLTVTAVTLNSSLFAIVHPARTNPSGQDELSADTRQRFARRLGRFAK